MPEERRVITANIPQHLASKLDEAAARIDRTRSWIIQAALTEWIAEDERRYQLTLEAIADMDAGRVLSHEKVVDHFEERKRQRND